MTPPFTMIHLSVGSETRPDLAFMSSGHPLVKATYFNSFEKVGEETVPLPLAMALCDPWFEGNTSPSYGQKSTRVMADWPIDFGRARVLEGRMKKAIEQFCEVQK